MDASPASGPRSFDEEVLGGAFDAGLARADALLFGRRRSSSASARRSSPVTA
ncbi:hypothetical protein [Streptomyces paradoxus]|uniref:Uncharacterized protein n=1 Tax=Streptomyces paradoxus TaxID=66375 RepID=A0A7W9T8Z6_9ACTN|nr:hypothetical protein [Streptomyces paradoxus]MBB6075776.1 hypothetical protein [Streptomyces paradoxus]